MYDEDTYSDHDFSVLAYNVVTLIYKYITVPCSCGCHHVRTMYNDVSVCERSHF